MIPLNPQITNAGLALFPNPHLPGFNVELTHIAIGSGKYNPTGLETSLVAEVAKFKILPLGIANVPRQLQIGARITDQDEYGRSANEKWIGEIGFYAGDTLFAVWSQADKFLFYKTSAFDVALAYTMDVSRLPKGSVTVVVDPDTPTLQAIIFMHEANANPHPQYAMVTALKASTDAAAAALLGHIMHLDPHPQYAMDTDLSASANAAAAALAAHVAHPDPHPQYLTPSEANAAYVKQGGGLGQLPNAVMLGWSGAGLKAQVDSTDLGNIAFEGWVLQRFADLIGAAPETLNQLNELAAAIGSDPNFAVTMSNALATKERKFDPGTRMLFQQSTAPVGWTKVTSHDNKALRIVSGDASAGGTLGFTTVFANGSTGGHALTIEEMPAHGGHIGTKGTGAIEDAQENPNYPAETLGGGRPHSHSINLDVQYVDVIIASKD